jgi:hypothetical protein
MLTLSLTFAVSLTMPISKTSFSPLRYFVQHVLEAKEIINTSGAQLKWLNIKIIMKMKVSVN